MKIYLVGGAVRDQLLNLPVKERDWVVVGASAKDMLAKGYRQVGKEFPVFLHPQTNEEYALARKERKTSPGYTGFEFDVTPSVTLEEDLERRDLTINAMAQSENGKLIDLFNGASDIKSKTLRHVSTAFPEDPVRILRVARLMARLSYLGFHIATETMHLMKQMVNLGEVDALVPERVWKELERALGERHPDMFFEVLNDCDALAILFPELTQNETAMLALKKASELSHDANIRFAAMLSSLPKKNIDMMCDRYRLPNAYRELAVLSALHHKEALSYTHLSADNLVDLFGKLDIYRRFDRFENVLIVCEAIANAAQQVFNPVALLQAAEVAKKYNVRQLLEKGLKGNELAERLRAERVALIKKWQS